MKISNKILLVGLASILVSILIVMIYGKNQIYIYNNPLIRIQHNAPDINKSIEITGYHGLKVIGDYEIQISNGANQLTMEGDSQMIEITKMEVKDSILIIGLDESFHIDYSSAVKINIHCPSLRSIEYLGSGNVVMQNEFAESNVAIKLTGSGDLSTKFNSSHINVDLLGSGNIINEGSSESMNINLNGSGDVTCEHTSTKNATVVLMGSGNVRLSVSEQLNVQLLGSGDVDYIGDPKLNTSKMGSGSVNRIEK